MRSMDAFVNDARAGPRGGGPGAAGGVAWNQVPAFRKVEQLRVRWAPPRPDQDQDVIVLRDGPGFAELRPQFPDRRFFRMVPEQVSRPLPTGALGFRARARHRDG